MCVRMIFLSPIFFLSLTAIYILMSYGFLATRQDLDKHELRFLLHLSVLVCYLRYQVLSKYMNGVLGAAAFSLVI